jgi:hypothetical protein
VTARRTGPRWRSPHRADRRRFPGRAVGTAPGHAEQHRDEVGQEREQQELLSYQVAEALQNKPRAGPTRRPIVWGQGRQPPHRPHRHAQRHRVDKVQRGEPHHRQQGARQQRPRDRPEPKDRRPQRVGGRQQRSRDQPGDGRAPCGCVGAKQRLLHSDQDEQDRHRVQPDRRLGPQQGRGGRDAAGCHQQHPAAIDDIGDRASPQREDHQRDKAAHPGQSDVS